MHIGPQGRALARCLLCRPFSSAPLPNRTDPFPSIRLSSDYSVNLAVSCRAWILS